MKNNTQKTSGKNGVIFKNLDIEALFEGTLKYIINILVIYIIVILAMGLVRTLLSINSLFSDGITGFHLSTVVSEILSYLVMIELFRSFIEYFKARRIRLHSMIDPAIVFVVRELIVKLYQHDPMTADSLIPFGILLLCMGIIRTLAVYFSPKDETS